MKTKFDPLVQYQKQKLQLCETQIAKLASEVSKAKNKIDSLKKQLSKIKIPKNAPFSEFLSENARKQVHISQINSHQDEINNLNQEIAKLKEEYKLLHIEFEKVNHLQEAEQEKIIKFLKKKEQKDLDEIAILLHQKENT